MGIKEWFAGTNAPPWGKVVVFIDDLRSETDGIRFASDSLDDGQQLPSGRYFTDYVTGTFDDYMRNLDSLGSDDIRNLLARGDAALTTKIPSTDEPLSEALIQYHQACTQLEFFVEGAASLDADEEALRTTRWQLGLVYERYAKSCYDRDHARRESLRAVARKQLGKLQSKQHALIAQIDKHRISFPIRRVALTPQQQRDEIRSGSELSPAALLGQDLQRSTERINEQTAQHASQILSKLENDLQELFPSDQELSVETFLARSGEGASLMGEYMTIAASLTTAASEMTELCATVEELYESLRSAGTQPLITPVSHMSQAWVKMCERQRGGAILTTGATRLLQRCLLQYSQLASSELETPAFLTALDSISSYFDQCSQIIASHQQQLWLNEDYEMRGVLSDGAMKTIRNNLDQQLYPVCGLIRTALRDAYFLYRQHSQEGTDLRESTLSEV